MTNITIFKSFDDIVGFISKGHADLEDEMGRVVCNGISSLTLTAILSLIEVAKIPEVDMELAQEDGYLYLLLDHKVARKEKVQTILQSMEVGLRAIQENYKKFIKIQIQEVKDDSF